MIICGIEFCTTEQTLLLQYFSLLICLWLPDRHIADILWKGEAGLTALILKGWRLLSVLQMLSFYCFYRILLHSKVNKHRVYFSISSIGGIMAVKCISENLSRLLWNEFAQLALNFQTSVQKLYPQAIGLCMDLLSFFFLFYQRMKGDLQALRRQGTFDEAIYFSLSLFHSPRLHYGLEL